MRTRRAGPYRPPLLLLWCCAAFCVCCLWCPGCTRKVSLRVTNRYPVAVTVVESYRDSQGGAVSQERGTVPGGASRLLRHALRPLGPEGYHLVFKGPGGEVLAELRQPEGAVRRRLRGHTWSVTVGPG